jgi:hypothetical protein
MSSDYKIKISEPRAVALRKQADELDISVNTLMAQIVEGDTLGAPAAPREITFDDAASVFLGQLEPEHRKLIEDCAAETQRTPASYILSYIKLAHDQGNTAKAIPEAFDPTQKAVPAVALSNKSCEWCQKPLEDRNARYCPAPDDGTEPCGRQASLHELRMKRSGQLADKNLPHPHVMDRRIKV